MKRGRSMALAFQLSYGGRYRADYSLDPESVSEALKELKALRKILGKTWTDDPILRYSYYVQGNRLQVWCAHVDVHPLWNENPTTEATYVEGRIHTEIEHYSVSEQVASIAEKTIHRYPILVKFFRRFQPDNDYQSLKLTPGW